VVSAQVSRLGLEWVVGRAAWPDYTEAFVAALTGLAARGFECAIFGDIFEDAHREWSESVAARSGLRAELPLWGESTAALTREFLASGSRARFVTVRTPPVDPDRLGDTLSEADIDAFEAGGVDPGGERGEYHTVVTSCPLFSEPLQLRPGRRVQTGDCWALDFEVSAAPAVAPSPAG
jgi:diphthamide synthase (EF-2-diphthine--ammonia ligase)